MNNVKTKRKPPVDTLKSLGINESDIFPCEQKASFESTKLRLQQADPSVKFSINRFDPYNYKVTRTA